MRPDGTDCIQTYTGRKFFPDDPHPDDLAIVDVAHALSLKCRYNGHTTKFYSVGEHSVMLALCHIARHPTDFDGALELLFHDSGEFALPDVATPIKHLAPKVKQRDEDIVQMIRERIGLRGSQPDFVHEMDKRITLNERAQFMNEVDWEWKLQRDLKPLDVELRGWDPGMAEAMFLHHYTIWMYARTDRVLYSLSGQAYPWGASVLTQASTDHAAKQDWIEVDVLGGCARTLVRSENKMLERDRQAGKYPLPRTHWIRGDFEIVGRGKKK